jgi:ribosomal-protein-alanine N-acetyltransferase
MMVAEHNHEIIGYVIYELHPAHLTLLNFAIHPDYRRQRIGTALLDKLIYKLLSHRRMHLKAVVSESNDAAQLFFHRAGFNAVSIARKSYRDSDEDAYEMVYRPTEQQWENFGGAPVNRISAYELP